MRLIAGCILAAACIIFIAVPVSAQDRPFRQTHTIEIRVECMDTATQIIRGLNGYNLDASVFANEVHIRNVGQPGFTRMLERHAHFTRRVDSQHFRHVQEVLRGLGEVLSETENAQFLGARITDVEVRIAAISQEIERLSLMMAASDSLDVLIAIDFRLSQVMWERNNLVGQRNMLLAQASNPVINIRLIEPPEDLPEFVPPGFIRRVTEGFGDTWRGTWAAAGNLLVFIVRISIPLVVLSALLAFGLYVLYLGNKRLRKRKLAAVLASGAPIEAEAGSTFEAANENDALQQHKPVDTSETTTWLEGADVSETAASPELAEKEEDEA